MILLINRPDIMGRHTNGRLWNAVSWATVIAVIALSDPSSFTTTADGVTIYATSFFADWRPGDGEIVVSDLSAIDAPTGSVRPSASRPGACG